MGFVWDNIAGTVEKCSSSDTINQIVGEKSK